ncbi:MAG: rhodanese-related sulfurtransferase [Rhodospirillaceae bacterium]|nr:MAG: rhodanese-related sulfurtransferase [Rhodospirillaceae bacterium]
MILDTGVIEIDPVVAFAWHRGGEAILVDVREDDEWAEAHIPGAVLSPMSEFEAAGFPRKAGRRLVVVCGIGKRSEAIARVLVQRGEGVVYNLSGGLKAWQAAGLPVVPDDFGLDPVDALPDDFLYRMGAWGVTYA